MDPIKIMSTIFIVAKTIHDYNKQVKANKNQCQRLSERVECIVGVLETRRGDEFNGTAMKTALQSLAKTLDESAHFLKKFTDACVLVRFLNNSDHQKQFEMLNMHLSHNATDLNLALEISSLFDPQQDANDRQADLAEILSKLDDIALTMAQQQEDSLKQNKEMKNEFKRRFDSFKFNLKRDVLKAENSVEAKKIEAETQLFRHIPGYDLVSEEKIGEGGFADVYRGAWLSQHHRVAIKTIRITYMTDKVKESFLNEIAAMYKIRYDHVLGVFGACIEQNYHALVVEYMSLGSLFDVLEKKQHVFSWPDRWSIALQMTKGINYLHEMSFLHRDIKSLNFLMDIAVNGYLVKISDFGLAKIRQETTRQTTERAEQQVVVGTLQWKAPELLKLGKPSKASDIYSLGVVFWELATGCVPYDEVDPEVILQSVKSGERLEIPNDIPSSFASIISNAWSQEVDKRSTSQDLIREIMIITSASTQTPVLPKPSLPTAPVNDIDPIIPSNDLKKPKTTPTADDPSKTLYPYHNSRLEALIAKLGPGSGLNLNKQQLTDPDMEIVLQQAIIDKKCTNLRLEYNSITSKGIKILAAELYRNTTLHELWLYTNHVADDGVHHLAMALEVNTALKKLGLASNHITNIGVRHLVEMLKRNCTLTILGLAMNEIDDKGVDALANVLAYENTTLEVLTLDRNISVSDASVDCLINMIKHNRSMKELWVNKCSLTETGKKKLRNGTASKKDFKLVTDYQHSS